MNNEAPLGANLDSIDQDDSWKVIDSYFKQNGLVAQQIFSFERFLRFSVQEVIKEYQETIIPREQQYHGDEDEEATYKLIFGNATVSNYPHQHEEDGSYTVLWPHEARVRRLTYQTEVYCDVELKKINYGEKNKKTGVAPILKEETLYND